MTLDEFEERLAAIIGRPSLLRPFVCDGSPLDCDILLVGFNPRTPMPSDYWSFWRSGYGFDKLAFERAYEASRLAGSGSEASRTREVMRRIARGASGCRIVEANLYPKDSENERALAPSDRDLRPFRLLLSAIQPRVVVPFGRFAEREFASIQVSCPVEPVKHFSRGWGYNAAEAFGARLAALCQSPKAVHSTPSSGAADIPSHESSKFLGDSIKRVVPSIIGNSRALMEAAQGLDLILDDHLTLDLKIRSSQVSIWGYFDNKRQRLFRLKLDGVKADLLIHNKLIEKCDKDVENLFDLSCHKNDTFRRFFDDRPEKTRKFLSEIRAGTQTLLVKE